MLIFVDVNMIGFARWLKRRLRYEPIHVELVECFELVRDCNDEDLIYLAETSGALILTWDRDFPERLALRPPEKYRHWRKYYKALWGWFWKELERRGRIRRDVLAKV